MSQFLKFIFILSIILWSGNVSGQDILDEIQEEIAQIERELEALELSEIEVEQKSTRINIGTDFTSFLNYHGRKTTDKNLLGLTPYASVKFKPGLYALAAANLTPSGNELYDGTYAQGGYKHEFSKKISAGLYVSKYFYPDASTQLNSDVDFGAGANIWVEIGDLTINPHVGYDIGGENDINNSLSVDYFIAKTGFGERGNNILVLDPAIKVFAGSQHFYENYYDRRVLRFFFENYPVTRPVIRSSLQKLNEAAKYDLLSAQLSLPVTYYVKKVGIEIAPQLVVPFNVLEFENLNLLRTAADNNILADFFLDMIDASEDACTTFLINGGLSFRF